MLDKEFIVSFDSVFQSRQHFVSPYGWFNPFPAGAGFSSLFSFFQHFHWFCFHLHIPSKFAFLPRLRSTPIKVFHRYYGGSDSCAAVLRSDARHERRPFPRRPPCFSQTTSSHSAANHPMTHHGRFDTLPLNAATMARHAPPGFAFHSQARRVIWPNRVRHTADCEFSSRCSPPHIAVTQLRSDTDRRASV